MTNYHITVTGMAEADRAAKKIQAAMQPERMDSVVESAAQETRTFMVFVTPNKTTVRFPATATGGTANSWMVEKSGVGSRVVRPRSEGAAKIVAFLSYGTQAHGPVHAKALFIPLTMKAKAAYAAGGTFKRSFSVSTFKGRGFTTTAAGKTKRLRDRVRRGTVTVRRAGDKSGGVKLVFGVDYILTKRVKGITASNIVEMGREFANQRLYELASEHIEKAIS